MRIAVATAALLVLLPAALVPAASAQARSQKPAKSAKPHAAAHSEHRPSQLDLATKGNGEAQFQVGMATLHSRGAHDKLVSQSLVWLGLAAANGIAPAAAEGARLYEGKGDLAEAARWWYRAGALGDDQAQGRFVDLYLAGKAPDLGGGMGADWLAARAASGDTQAKLALGDALERGLGVAVDRRQAQRWYLDAAMDGSAEAMYRLGRLQIHLPAVWRAVGRETGRDGKWLGPVTFPVRLDGRNPDTHEFDLGRAAVAAANNLDQGDLTLWRPGMVEGEMWLQWAARLGHAGAQFTLARAYLGGLDLPADLPDAVRWLEASGAQGNAGALMTLADLAAKGQGFRNPDPVRAWVCYDIAAIRGADGAAAARDRIAKSLQPRQLARARQISQEVRDLAGM